MNTANVAQSCNHVGAVITPVSSNIPIIMAIKTMTTAGDPTTIQRLISVLSGVVVFSPLILI